MPRSPALTFALKWAVCLVLLGLLLARVDLAGLWAQLRHVHAGWLFAGLALCLANTLCAAAQFKTGLDLLEMPLSFARVTGIVLISAFYSVVVPAGMVAGGLASFYKFTRDSRKFMEAGVLVVMFRVLNTMLLMALGFCGAWSDRLPLDARGRWLLSLAALGSLLACLPWLLPSLARRIARFPAPRKIQTLMQDGADVLARFRATHRLRILGWGLLVNLTNLFAWVALAHAAGVPLAVPTLLWIAALQGILQMLPFTIGGLGLREVTLVALLAPHGVAAEQALAFSALILLVMVLNTIAGGLLELFDRPRRPSPQPA